MTNNWKGVRTALNKRDDNGLGVPINFMDDYRLFGEALVSDSYCVVQRGRRPLYRRFHQVCHSDSEEAGILLDAPCHTTTRRTPTISSIAAK